MKAITSKDNPLFKTLKKVESSSKERRELNKTLLDGVHLIDAYCEQMGIPEMIILNQTTLHKGDLQPFLASRGLLDKITVLPDALYNEISSVKSPTGMMALIAIPAITLTNPINCAVLLEGIQDPGNLGSILRSAAAAGVQQIYLSTHCVDAWSPKALRGGMGAHFFVAIKERVEPLDIVKAWQGLRIATKMHAPKTIFDVTLTQPSLFMIGNEGAGLSPNLMQHATDIVSIPMQNEIESLNAACAASICFFERVRQLTKN